MDKWQEKWAYNKYWVMAHSQAYYEQIRLLAKNNDWSDAKNAEFEDLLAKAASEPPTVKTLTNAYQHVWGYFKKIATTEEKQTYLRLLQELSPQTDKLGPFLSRLTEKYQVAYLLNSRLMQEWNEKS
ncbi:YbgA family protein [Lactobacillus panisapium]|uniref:YbgA family protein n=1 Tax=Lactobacillus panisapium TaxID=2012495 RepID=UPI0022E13AA7|nr:YbgA family protein [Lactobacillus panisapium]